MFEVTCYDYTGEQIDFLVQWDTGVTIEIRDIELPETPIIHFSNKYSDKSLALRDGVIYENKTLIAPIPDELLREPYMLTVYIYAHEYDKNRGKTTNIAKLPIMAKPKPVGYVEKQTYEGINVLALKANVDKNTVDIGNLKTYDDTMAADIKENSANIAINNANISQNATDISNLSKFVGDIPTSSSAMSVVTYADEIVFVESTRATGIESSLSDRLDDAELDIVNVKKDIKDNFEIFDNFKDNSEETIGYLRLDIDKATEDLSKTMQNLNSLESDVYTKSEVEYNFAAKSSEHVHDNQDVLNGITKENVEQWNSASGGDVGDLLSTIFNAIYPIGSIYMSVDSTNPSSVFGGTWESWGNGRVPVGVDSSQTEFDVAEKTGGEKTHALTIEELPSHTHTGIEHTHTIPSHSHGLNSHSHTIPELSGTTSSAGSHAHTPSNNSNFMTTDADKVVDDTGSSSVIDGSGYDFPRIEETYSFTKAAKTSSDGAHTHTITTTSAVTGNASGNTSNSGVLTSGSAGAGNVGDTGSNMAHNNLQPYITCYMWKRLTLS